MITRRQFLKIAGCAALTTGTAGLAGCSGSSTEPVKAISKITQTVNSTSDNKAATRTVVTEFSYDSNGNLSQTTVTVEYPYATNMGTTINTYAIDYDGEGNPTRVSQSQSNQQNNVSAGESDITSERDSAGRYTKLESGDAKYEYEYDGNGNLVKETSTGPFAVTSEEYDEKGWAVSGSVSGSYDLKRDSSGNVTAYTYKNISGKEVMRTFELDSDGYVTSITENSEKICEIEYTQIEKPSAAMRAFAKVKQMDTGQPVGYEVFYSQY